MQSSQLVIAGAGGHARVVIEAVRSQGRWMAAALTDPVECGSVLGVPVVGGDDELPRLRDEGVVAALVGVGSLRDPTHRIKVFERLVELDFILPPICHFRATVSPSAGLGDGTVILGGAIVNSQASIGQNVIVNTGSIVEHDCQVGDHAHIAPRAVLGGGVTICPRAHVGMGAVVVQGLTIGEGSVVGAGAVVTRDVPPDTLCVGVPAKPVRDLGDDNPPG